MPLPEHHDQPDRLFDRLLVPLDGSPLAEHAIPYARALAKPGTDITLIEVVPAPRDLAGPFAFSGIPAEEMLRFDREAAERYLDAAAAALRAATAGVTVRAVVEVGDPAVEIVRGAGQTAAGVIVIASHGRGALGRFAFGSVADRVARNAPIPVLIARAQNQPPVPPVPIRRLLVPLDGSERAERALPVAAALARRLSLPIHVISVVDAAQIAFITTAPEVFAAVRSAWHAEAQETVAQAVARLTADGLAASGAVVEGAAAETIANSAQAGDVIVLTSHGRGGVMRWVLGSVAEKLVREGPVPVLLVKTAAPVPPASPDVPPAPR